MEESPRSGVWSTVNSSMPCSLWASSMKLYL